MFYSGSSYLNYDYLSLLCYPIPWYLPFIWSILHIYRIYKDLQTMPTGIVYFREQACPFICDGLWLLLSRMTDLNSCTEHKTCKSIIFTMRPFEKNFTRPWIRLFSFKWLLIWLYFMLFVFYSSIFLFSLFPFFNHLLDSLDFFVSMSSLLLAY